MKTLFISQPMRDKTDAQILEVRDAAIEKVRGIIGEDVEVLNTFFGTSDMSHALEYLGESIKMLAKADIAYFAPGWSDARGCKIEHLCAREYGIRII